MKYAIILIAFAEFGAYCSSGPAPLEAFHDDLNYESITGSKGLVMVKLGDSLITYKNADRLF